MALCTGSRTSDDQINNDFFMNIESNQTPKVLPVASKSVEQEEALLSQLSIGNDAYGAREASCKRCLSILISRHSNRDAMPTISDEEMTTLALRIKELARGYPRSGEMSYGARCQRVGYAIGAYGDKEEGSESGGRKLKSKCFLRVEAGKADPDAYSGDGPLMKDFCKEFNQRTAQLSGEDLGVVIKIYDDGTFSFTFGHFTPIPTGLL